MNPDPSTGTDDGGENPDVGPDPENDDEEFSFEYVMESASGDKSIFDADKYTDYLDIGAGFEEWCKKYIVYNGDTFNGGFFSLVYTSIYKENDYYQMMTSALNHDAYKTKISIEKAGEDYEEMFLMMDHGLIVELKQGKTPDNLVMYSGITPERKAAVAGVDRSRTDVTVEELVDQIGQEYTDEAIMSTTVDPTISFNFSGGDYGSKTIFILYCSREAMDDLGTINVDSLEGSPYTFEQEILFNANARYRILDVGKCTGYVIQGSDRTEGQSQTYIRLELLGVDKDPSEKMDGAETLSEPEYVWAEDNKSVTASVTINEESGEKVEETTTDISVEVIKEPTADQEGTGKYTAHFKNDYFSDQEKTVVLPAESGSMQPENAASDINVTISRIKDKTYTGKAIRPRVTVKVGGKKLVLNKDYTLSYKKNKKVGKATVIIKGIGAYKGTCKKSFRILPKGTKLTRAKTNKKAIALAWKKNVKQTTGYQTQYGLKKSFKGAKIKTLKNKAGRLTLKGLKSRKKYYIRIRTYKTIGKKKYCSRWSKVKKATVK